MNEAQKLRAKAKAVAKTRDEAVEAGLEIARELVLVAPSESVQKGLEAFFGLEDLKSFLAGVETFKQADQAWTEASETLLKAVGGRVS